MPVTRLQPQRLGDNRGWFSETFSVRRFAERGIDVSFCQDNQSLSAEPGVLRGLHFQAPLHAQDKLVSCLRAVWDVAVDLRRVSPTYGTGSRSPFRATTATSFSSPSASVMAS